ncbi:MAG: methyltransferase domain-containing protein [Chloroflexota bacterium]
MSVLTCPVGCGTDLAQESARTYGRFGVSEELVCSRCNSRFPVVSGVPVLFADSELVLLALDREHRQKLLTEVEGIDRATRSAIKFSERERLVAQSRKPQALAVSWEYFLIPTISGHDMTGFKGFFSFVERHESPLAGKVALNVGCGLDPLGCLLQEKGAVAIAQDVVLDVLLSMDSRGVPGVCCDLRRLPFKKGSLDMVVSHNALHHIWPIEVPVREACRVLKPGGGFYCTEPNSGSLSFRVKRIIPRIAGNFLWKVARKGIRGSPFEKPIRLRELVEQLRHSGPMDTIEVFFSKRLGPSLGVEYLARPLLLAIPSLSASFFLYGRKAQRNPT